MTNKIRQVSFNQFGTPEVLQLTEAPMLQAQPGEVVIKITAIGVNYADVLRRTNRYFMPTPLPFVLGSEVVGYIEELGNGVPQHLAKGSRVLAILPHGGGYASHVSAPAQFCIPLPPMISDVAATAIFVQGTTAQLMVSQLAGDLNGKTVLIHAAAGGVGSLLVQLAKMHGATVIGAASNSEKLELIGRLGADAAIDYSKPGWSEVVKEVNMGKGVDIIFEMVGGEVYNEGLKCLAPGGHMIVYGCASGIQGQVHPEHFVDENISQSGFNLAFYIQNKMQLWQQALGTVIGLVAAGKLKIETPKTFRLEDAAEAHRQLEGRETTGKVVLLA